MAKADAAVRRCHVAVDGGGWREEWASALLPLLPEVLAVDRWPPPAAAASAAAHLDWLSRRFAERPLLGFTWTPYRDTEGSPVRGVSRLGEGVALVSRAGLRSQEIRGVVRHELAHALGLDHCAFWSCALSERYWPLDLADRGPGLCAECEAALQSRVGEQP
jgi:hypothetical protein